MPQGAYTGGGVYSAKEGVWVCVCVCVPTHPALPPLARRIEKW